MRPKPILCIDFDGVIHSYTSNWEGITIIPDKPVTGAFGFIKKASKFFDVQVFSSRSKSQDGIDAMKYWIAKHDISVLNYVTFPTEKPPAFLTLDDRAMLFMGFFPDPEKLVDFTPWNKGDR